MLIYKSQPINWTPLDQIPINNELNFNNCETNEICLVQAFYEKQEKLPLSLRGVCMISCPCKRCNPFTL